MKRELKAKQANTPKCGLLLLDRHNRVLLQLRDDKPDIPFPNCWGTFGGAIEPGETAEQAIVREIREELDYELSEFTYFGNYPHDGYDVHMLYHRDATLSLSDLTIHEGQRGEFLTPAEVRQLKCAFNCREIVEAFFRMYAGDVSPTELVEEMSRHYEHRAPWHDDYMSYTDNASHELLLAPVIADVEPLIQGRKVLEIACGTGNWTHVLAKRAATVLATDVSESALAIARDKLKQQQNVEFICASAYALDSLPKHFEAAVAIDWYSHIPKSLIHPFLKSVQGRLEPGAPVVFVDIDMIPEITGEPTRYDAAGNRIGRRTLPDGSEFDVVKNFPGEIRLSSTLDSLGSEICFRKYDSLHRWLVSYRSKPQT
ncbi:MAG: methyltransferase domain-containing protein [bacterium]